MHMKISNFVLLVCGTLPFAYSESVYQISVKGGSFESVRSKRPPKSISECNTVVTEPYGLLEQTYKRGQVKGGASCSWTLHAPPHHVVSVISMGFDLLDEIPAELAEQGPSRDDSSVISLYDGIDSRKRLYSHNTGYYGHAGSVFLNSISSKQDMLVKIDYRDVKGYATVKAFIKYQFVNVDDMKRLLRGR